VIYAHDRMASINQRTRAEMAVQCCTSRIFAFEWTYPVPLFNPLFLTNLGEYYNKSYIAKPDSLGHIFVAYIVGLI